MALELKLTLKLTQQLVMTPALQQAIKLLQLSRIELEQSVREELDQNPCLEEDLEEESSPDAESDERGGDEVAEVSAEADSAAEAPGESAEAGDEPREPEAAADSPDGPLESSLDASEAESEPEPSAVDMVGDLEWESYMESRPQTTSIAQGREERPSIEDTLKKATSLADHLLWQLGFADLCERDRQIGVIIIGSLGPDGYLKDDVDTIAELADATADAVEKVRLRIQEFDPVGVAARDLAECLLVQMRVHQLDHPLALRITEHHLDLLKRKDYRGIARLEDVTIEEVGAAARVVGSFEPRPGRRFAEDEPIYITPDIFVHKIGDEYHVVLNEDGMPKLRVSRAYRSILSPGGDASKETKEFVREKMRSAQWLIKSIHQRQNTIMKVMNSILRFQREFFDRGPEFLRPLNLRDVADDIEMHESTVSRVTTAKYTQTPHGVFELKFFFNSSIRTSDGEGIASESVKEKIQQIIKAEDSSKPYSDQKIAEILKQSDIHIARRTVTKYREALRILASTSRRQIG